MTNHCIELAVVMPVYNEAACICEVVDEWIAEMSRLEIDFKIIVLNDGSRDETDQRLAVYGDNPRVEVINKPNSGHGPTILSGYRMAVQKAQWVFQVDSDDEMSPDMFHTLWEQRENYDVLFGYRAHRVQSLQRRLMTLCSRLLVRLLFGAFVYDVNTPYRLMRKDFLQAILPIIPDDTFAPNVLISSAVNKGHRSLSLPVIHRYRRTGSVSLVNFRLISIAFLCFRQTVKFRRLLK